jgi:integrase
MPTHKGVYRKGKKFYGAKWYQRKTYVTKLFDTAAEAAEAREELIRILNKGVQPDKKNVTITDFIKLFLKKYLLPKQNVQRISINAFERNMRNSIIPFIGNMKLKGLTPEIMQDLQNKLLAKHASSSAAIIMNQFKRVVKRAVIWRYISYDPTLDLDSITVEIEKPDILTPEQVLLILNHESIDLRQRTIIGLGGFGGLRESEIMAIKKTKINFNTCCFSH